VVKFLFIEEHPLLTTRCHRNFIILPVNLIFLRLRRRRYRVHSNLSGRFQKRVPSSGSTNSHQTVADGFPVPETDSTSLSKEYLRSRVYTIMRDVAKIPFASLRRRRYRVHSNLSGRFQNRKPRV
jgi:hypothetical protein